MALLKLRRNPAPDLQALAGFLAGFSIEVMPRTAAKIEDFAAILPQGAEVFVAHIDGTPQDEMRDTVARLTREGFDPVPHIPARIVPDLATLRDWVASYRAAGARKALLLGGGLDAPKGSFDAAIQLLQTGLFDDFDHLFIAGHPEGNRDIDPAGGEANVMAALHEKQAYAAAKGLNMTIVTQFLFEADPAIAWAERLAASGITLPVRIGAAGPAKLQTMIKFAISCGVGPSLRVLQRRARDVTKLVMPFEPDDFLTAIATHKRAHPDSLIAAAHLFPLGGIRKSTDWIARATAPE